MQNFVKNNLCKVSKKSSRLRLEKLVSRPRPSLETPSLIASLFCAWKVTQITCYIDSAIRVYCGGLHNKVFIWAFLQFIIAWRGLDAWRGLVLKPITAASSVVSNHVLYVIDHTVASVTSQNLCQLTAKMMC